MPEQRRKRKLERHRLETLSDIDGKRVNVQAMVQRHSDPNDIDDGLLQKVLTRFAEIEEKAKTSTRVEELDDLAADAEQQGQFRAYFCPVIDIHDEGEIVIEVIEGWGVPKTAIETLRRLFAKKFENAVNDPAAARSALRLLFEEMDEWDDYVDDYEDTLRPWSRWLFFATVSLPLLGAAAFAIASKYPAWFSFLLIVGLMCGGAAGSCVSVATKMPALDRSLAGELEAYGRRILGRISIGVIASLIGSASLAWLPVSIQNHSFSDAINACASATAAGINILILLGIPMILGFSERTLASFEQRVLDGPSAKAEKI